MQSTPKLFPFTEKLASNKSPRKIMFFPPKLSLIGQTSSPVPPNISITKHARRRNENASTNKAECVPGATLPIKTSYPTAASSNSGSGVLSTGLIRSSFGELENNSRSGNQQALTQFPTHQKLVPRTSQRRNMTNRFKLAIAAFCFILIASVMAPVSKAQNGDS